MMIRMNRKGFTLVEIMIVVAIIGLLAAIAIPNFVKARTRAQQEACIANLKQIEGAVQVWAIDNNKGSTDTPGTTDLVDEYIRTWPTCPGGGAAYAPPAVSGRPTCNIAGHSLQ
ncbi:MAG: prepilin-type N-terminal cleavage/methylation domain-containing protein [Candidatus Omnitrophota bacterium]